MQINLYGKIAAYFVDNKKFSLLVLIGIVLWGSISFWVMPKQYNPDIVAPAFLIEADFPGATVDEVYKLVTKPLEDALNELPGIENIYSRSFQGGKSMVTVQFFVGEALSESMILLRQKISSRMNLKPLGVLDPSIRSIDPEDLPVKTLSLYSNTLTPIELRKRAYQIKDRLKLASGIAQVDVYGGRRREFQISINPEKMKESKTSLDEIAQVLQNSSLLRDLGVIKTADKYFHVETQGQVMTATDIGEIVIASNFEKNLKIKDVATIVATEEEYESYVRFDKKGEIIKNALFISLAKQKGKNIIDACASIDKLIVDLKQKTELFAELTIETVKDEGRVASEEIGGLVINLLQSIGVVFLVLLLFLNYRAALIVAVSIPLTLLAVMGVGNLFGYTINRITLFGLILSLGLLVDSATVAIENIVSNKKKLPAMGKTDLIALSISEVGVGLFLSTLTTVIAFIPMSFVTGMMGPYMGPLPFFVSSALIVSLIFAYTLNPWLAAVFCKDNIDSNIKQKCGVICKLSDWFLKVYKSLLSFLMDNKRGRKIFLKLAFLFLLIVLLFPVFQLLRFRMLPKADREQIFLYLDLDRGTSIERTNEITKNLVTYFSAEENILSIQSFVGTGPVLDFNGLFKGVSARVASNQATVKFNLVHPNQRKLKSEQLARSYRTLAAKALEKVSDARFQIIEDPPGPPVQSTFYVKLKTENEQLLSQVTHDLEAKVRGIEQVKDIDISLLEKNNKYVLSVDKEVAAKTMVSVSSVSDAVETIFKGKIIGVYHSLENDEQEHIVLKFERRFRDDISKLNDVFVANKNGNHIALADLVKVSVEDENEVILNDNREKVAYISGEMGKRSVTYACIDLLGILYAYSVDNHKLKLVHFSPLKFEYLVDGKDSLKIELGGEWELTIKVFRDLGLAMLIAIVLIYLVLVAQFKTFLIPLLILGTIPLALIGVIPGFAFLFVVGNVYFSATSMIGVIALAGIVVNNAIIFVEYVLQVAKNKSSLKETLLDAGLTRMRPILLTSCTTVLGSLVIATDPVWSGLSWAIVFGLSLSAGLTLVVFPVLVYHFLGDKWFDSLKAG